MELSWIQRHALFVLLRSESARIKDMTPPDVPANLFSYHLDGLIKMGIIEKAGRGVYRLTAKGLKFAGKFSTATNHMTEEIKTVVMLYGKHEDRYLLFCWSRQPYMGKVTPLYDRVPFAKSLDAGVSSALNDKLGAVRPVTYRGSAIIRIMMEDELISHMNAFIYEVKNLGELLPFTSRNGESSLLPIDDPRVMEGVREFIEAVEGYRLPIESTWRYGHSRECDSGHAKSATL